MTSAPPRSIERATRSLASADGSFWYLRDGAFGDDSCFSSGPAVLRRADALQAALARSAAPSQIVLSLMGRAMDNLVVTLAAAGAGLSPAFMSPHLPPDEIESLIAELRPAVVLVDLGSSTTPAGLREAIEDRVATTGVRVVSGTGDPVISGPTTGPARVRSLPVGGVITHTSGTTGLPKLVRTPWPEVDRRVANQARSVGLYLKALRPRNRSMLGTVPAAHVRTITGLLAASQLGQTLVMPDLSGHTVDAVHAALSEFRPWYFESPPELLQHVGTPDGPTARLLTSVQLFQTTFSTSNARTIGVCLDASAHRRATYMVTYGQTEVGPICVRLYTRRHRPREPDLCVGMPLVHPRRLGLAPRPADAGTDHGVLFVERVGTSPTYVVSMEERDTPSTSAPPDDHRDWHDTGDVLRRTRRGCFHYLGRAGVTDGLVALEGSLLSRLPEASDIVLVRVADEVRPLVVTDAGIPLADERWATAVSGAVAAVERAPALATPTYLGWDALPRNPSWKVRRVALAQQLLAESGAGS